MPLYETAGLDADSDEESHDSLPDEEENLEGDEMVIGHELGFPQHSTLYSNLEQSFAGRY